MNSHVVRTPPVRTSVRHTCQGQTSGLMVRPDRARCGTRDQASTVFKIYKYLVSNYTNMSNFHPLEVESGEKWAGI